MTQELVAGVLMGSLATGLFAAAWHLAKTADLRNSHNRLVDALAAKNDRLRRITLHFLGQKSGTARLAVKLARGQA
jgi:hypothetical protein